jgi:ATP-dependent DNA helicase RecG
MPRDDEVLSALHRIAEGERPDRHESTTLDFKQEKKTDAETIRDLLDACLCFANASGGVVVLGVADKLAGPSAFVGFTIDPDLLQRRIFELSRPGLVVDIQREGRFAEPILLVFVPRSPDIHADTQGRAPRRVGTSCLPMEPAEQSRLRDERRGFDWSAQPTDTRMSEVSPAAIEATRGRLRTLTDKRRDLARLSDADLLRALRVVSEDGVLTRAGALLFCGPSSPVATLGYQYRATPAGEPKVIERIETPLVTAFERTLELVKARLNLAPVTLPDGQQLQLEDFPELAVREAISNAFIHRDYHLALPCQIEHSPEILAITSPGPLVSGVTPENILTHPSKPRNPSLASCFRLLGFAEEVGRGVDRMYREMIRSGGRIPQIWSDSESVRVALVGGAPNGQIARFVAQLPPEERDDTDTMLVLFSLCSAPSTQASKIASVLHRSEEEAEAVLRRLASDPPGMLEATRETARRAHPTYRLRADALKALGRALSYHRRSVDEIDRKVIAHVREYGKVTNKTLQNLLDVSLQRARAILGDLVARELLKKTSSHERGPGVEYGPGKKFPPARKRR